MRCFVNSRCFGCRMCAVICPQLFSIVEGGYAKAQDVEIPLEWMDDLEDAIKACAAHAIVEKED